MSSRSPLRYPALLSLKAAEGSPSLGALAADLQRLLCDRLSSSLTKDRRIGRAEALRQAVLSFLENRSLSPSDAYPAIWGPFALIGEGAAR
jgi:hypothetical protein